MSSYEKSKFFTRKSITYTELIQIGILIVNIISLFIQAKKK